MSYWDHIKQSFKAVSIYDGTDVFVGEFRRLPIHIGDLLATHWTLSEISNGGLHQFFLNPTGVLAPEAAEGFDRMGLTDVAALLRSAMVRFGETYPREQEERESFLKSHGPEVFEPLERKLYEVGASDLGRIYDVMDEYATRNAG